MASGCGWTTRVIIDGGRPHESSVRRPVTGGRRRFKVEYYDVAGFAELRFEILRNIK